MQTIAGHFLSLIWASYSSLKYLRVVRTGLGAVWPRPQRDISFTITARSSSILRSSIRPFPEEILSRIRSICFVPSRQGTHLPQDSLWVNSRKNFETSTMQVSSSMTTRPPEPMMAPAAVRDS